jgi:hypothetical protein
MLEFCADKGIEPMIEIMKLSQVRGAGCACARVVGACACCS